MREPVLKTSKVLQIAFIVSDVQAAAEKYARLFGIETPQVSMSDGYEKAQTVFMGKPSPARCKMAFIDLDNIQLEFIEPDENDSDWKRSLEEKGNSLHHIAFEVKDMKKQIKSLEEDGAQCIQKGEYPGGRYAFMDTADEYMVKFELLEND